MSTLKPQSNRPLYGNTVIGTMAADGWFVTFSIARRGLVCPWQALIDVLNVTRNCPTING